MSCLGVHFAITPETVTELLAAESDEDVKRIVERIEGEDWAAAPEFAQETNKAWDAIHRCFADGTTDIEGGEYPLNRAVLGGMQLYDGHDYVVVLVTREEVRDVAAALSRIDEEEFRRRYARLSETDYRPVVGPDFDYTFGWFEQLKAFYARAASAGRSVIFTVDQ